MIRSISIRHFRCFDELEIRDCRRLNIVVGENGSGKTSLLEGIILPLSSGTEIAMRLRSFRGLEGNLTGTSRIIEEAIWGDFFHNRNFSRSVQLALSGDGPEARKLEISKSNPQTVLPFGVSGVSDSIASSFVNFDWTDSVGRKHSVTPRISAMGVQLPDTGEDIPNFAIFPAGINVSSTETAGRFSELSKRNESKNFIKIFANEYKWITDLNVELNAGMPLLYATLKDSNQKVPLNNVSHGINRLVSIMLAISSAKNSVILVDEIENGIFFSHFGSMWRIILRLLDESKAQLFVTTHSLECLRGLAKVSKKYADQIRIFRSERVADKYTVQTFVGKDFQAAMEYGEDIR